MQPNLTTPFRGLPDQGHRLTTSPFKQGHRLRTWCWLRNLLTLVTYNVNLFGGQGNGKRRCWYMHFNLSSLVPHPQLKLVNKFGNLNNIKLYYNGWWRHISGIWFRKSMSEPSGSLITLLKVKVETKMLETFMIVHLFDSLRPASGGRGTREGSSTPAYCVPGCWRVSWEALCLETWRCGVLNQRTERL